MIPLTLTHSQDGAVIDIDGCAGPQAVYFFLSAAPRPEDESSPRHRTLAPMHSILKRPQPKPSTPHPMLLLSSTTTIGGGGGMASSLSRTGSSLAGGHHHRGQLCVPTLSSFGHRISSPAAISAVTHQGPLKAFPREPASYFDLPVVCLPASPSVPEPIAEEKQPAENASRSRSSSTSSCSTNWSVTRSPRRPFFHARPSFEGSLGMRKVRSMGGTSTLAPSPLGSRCSSATGISEDSEASTVKLARQTGGDVAVGDGVPTATAAVTALAPAAIMRGAAVVVTARARSGSGGSGGESLRKERMLAWRRMMTMESVGEEDQEEEMFREALARIGLDY